MKHFYLRRLCLLALTLVLQPQATLIYAYSFETDGIYYDFHGDEAEVTFDNLSKSTCYSKMDVIIPDYVIHKYREFESGVFIEKSDTFHVTSIGYRAFYYSHPKSVTIPKSIKTIKEGAFGSGGITFNIIDLSSYCNISFAPPSKPSSTDWFMNTLSINGEKTTDLAIPNGVDSIPNYAFYRCKLTSLSIPESVTRIGRYAFWACDSLSYVGIGRNVTIIGDGAFSRCKQITTLSLPENLLVLGDNAFEDCYHLNSVNIPNSVKAVGNRAFSGCTNMVSAAVGHSVTTIGREAFYNCVNLSSVSVGSKVNSIGFDAFRFCDSLKAVHITDLAAWCGISFEINPSTNPLYYAHHLYLNGHKIEKPDVPDGVTTIGNYAFNWCKDLTSVNIPNSVTSIGNSAFNGCTGLTSAIIGNGVTSIGSSAFSGCTGLTSVDIGNSVTAIGRDAFHDCSSLMSVTIPNSVKAIGNDAFKYCI